MLVNTYQEYSKIRNHDIKEKVNSEQVKNAG